MSSRRWIVGLVAAFAAPWVVGYVSTVLPAARWLLPLVAPLAFFPEFVRRVRADDSVGAWRMGMAWALALSGGVLSLTLLRPDWAGLGIVHGTVYRDEMLRWIRTGVGPENDWRAFLPQHALHLGLFVALTAVSGGYLGLALGAALLGYMNFFVGSYAASAPQPLVAVIAAWVPWSILRVMAFVLLGAIFARPVLLRGSAGPLFGRRERGLLVLALSGIAGDVILKAAVASRYGLLLRDLLAP